jgi:voltage-gated potassium channel
MPVRDFDRLFLAVIFVISSFIIGIIGFMLMEGLNLVDSFYMTVITISTVGFREVQPLSQGGKVFTTFYILINVGIFLYAVSVISQYIFEGEFRKVFKNVISVREVKKMKDHVIVCGFGRNGMKAAEELYQSKKDFIVIDRSSEKMSDHKELKFVEGDASSDDTLMKAGIERASSIITTLPSDADNVFITLTAKELNPNIKVIARASENNTDKKLVRAGADHVVMPDMLGGLHMAQLITKPYVIEFLELLNGVGLTGANFILEEFSYEQLKNDFRDKSIKEMDIRNETGAQVIAIRDSSKGFRFSPSPHSVISKDSILIVLGTPESVNEFKKHYIS